MTDTPIEKLTRVYIKMRDAKAKLAAEFKEKEYSLNAQMDQVKAALLDYCKEHEVESVRTASGLVYRSKKRGTGPAIGKPCTGLLSRTTCRSFLRSA